MAPRKGTKDKVSPVEQKPAPKRKTIATSTAPAAPAPVVDESAPKKRTTKRQLMKLQPALDNQVQAVPAKRKSESRKSNVPKRQKVKLSIDDFIPSQKSDFVLTCGNGDMGQLGNGEDVTVSKKPRLVTSFPKETKFLQAIAGGMHSVVLTSEYEVFTCGNNDEGALGRTCQAEDQEDGDQEDNSKDEDFTFRIVQFPANTSDIVMVGAGDSHTAALTRDGSVFIWGTFRDKGGVLGLTLQNKKSGQVLKNMKTPFLLSNANERVVVKIASGSHHLVLLTENGKIYTVGAGDAGQLGRLSPHARDSAISHRSVVKMMSPAEIINVKNVFFVDVWCATYCTFARSSDGIIFAWGLNNYRQLGIPSDTEQEIHYPTISGKFRSDRLWKSFAGDHHILSVDEAGTLFGIGRGDDCKLGQGKDNAADSDSLMKIRDSSVKGVAAATGTSFYWDDQGHAFAWGYNSEAELGLGLEGDSVVEKPRELSLPKNLENCRFDLISANAQHTVFLASRR